MDKLQNIVDQMNKKGYKNLKDLFELDDEFVKKFKEEVRGDSGHTPTTEELLALIVPLIPQVKNGENYVLTEEDRIDIAKSIEVPVVDKVVERIIEKVEVIKEIPIVTENVVEVERVNEEELAIQTAEYLKTLEGDDRLPSTAISGLEILDEIPKIKRNAEDALALPPSTTNFFQSGALKGRAKNINVTGATVNVAGDMATITVTGGGGAGDVTGPASSTDNAIARYDGTTGKIIQNSNATIDDSGNLSLQKSGVDTVFRSYKSDGSTSSVLSYNKLTFDSDFGDTFGASITGDGSNLTFDLEGAGAGFIATNFSNSGITFRNVLSPNAGSSKTIKGMNANTFGGITNLAGGDIIISSGNTVGNGVSKVVIQAAGGGASGTALQSAATVATFNYNSISLGKDTTVTGNISATNLSGTNSGDVTLAGALDYITIAGQVITRNAIDLTTDVTGVLPAANGGTGVTSLTDMMNGVFGELESATISNITNIQFIGLDSGPGYPQQFNGLDIVGATSTYLGQTTFGQPAQRIDLTSVSVNTTLNDFHGHIRVDASGGNKTITTANIFIGRTITIEKSDSSINTVAVSLVTGTHTLLTQYSNVTIRHIGSNNWIKVASI